MKAIDAVTMECCGEVVEPRAVILRRELREGPMLDAHAVWLCPACNSLEHAWLAELDATRHEQGELSGTFNARLRNALRDSQRPDTEGR